jgi:hypothetical protein
MRWSSAGALQKPGSTGRRRDAASTQLHIRLAMYYIRLRSKKPSLLPRPTVRVIMMTGTSGRSARTLGSISRPLVPAHGQRRRRWCGVRCHHPSERAGAEWSASSACPNRSSSRVRQNSVNSAPPNSSPRPDIKSASASWSSAGRCLKNTTENSEPPKIKLRRPRNRQT